MADWDQLQFTADLLTRPQAGGMDAETTLRHFAIITYMVEPERLRPFIPPRFQLACVQDAGGAEKALVSIVPFVDVDFHFVRLPWIKWRFGQTNYRAYVVDSRTGEQAVWFFGTSLASVTNVWPRFAWKLPWHRARMQFDCAWDGDNGRYAYYRLRTQSRWAPAQVELADTGQPPHSLMGFDSLEAGLVLLTHPLKGFYYRRDGRVGSYTIWHDRLRVSNGRLLRASFPLLDRLGLVPEGDLNRVHSVLLQHSTVFTIYLPPSVETTTNEGINE